MPYEPTRTSWKPGQSGNPAGRPKGSKTRFTPEELDAAITEVEAETGKPMARHFVEMALKVPSVMRDLANRKWGPAPTDLGEKLAANPGRFLMLFDNTQGEDEPADEIEGDVVTLPPGEADD